MANQKNATNIEFVVIYKNHISGIEKILSEVEEIKKAYPNAVVRVEVSVP